MSKERIQWIDDAKGFAAILVIIGHIANSHIKAGSFIAWREVMLVIHRYIYMFHMPLFMLLSGFMLYKAYCVNREAKKKNYTLQVINIAWLYLFFALALWVAKMLFASSVVANVGLRDLWRIPIDPIDETWYLYVLFFLYLICYALEKIDIKEEIKLGILLAVCLAAEFVPLSEALPWYRILHYAFFFYCGVYLAKKPDGILTTKYSRWLYYIGAVVITMLYCITVNLAGIKIVNILVAFILSMAVVCFFMSREDAKGVVHKCLNCTGRYALEVYLLHTYVITVCRVLLPKAGITQFLPNMVISLVLCVLVPIWAVIVLKKLKLHSLIFRPVAYLKK